MSVLEPAQTLATAMKKPPDPLLRLSQPPLQSAEQPFLSFSANHTDFLSYLLKSNFSSHHCFATCKLIPLLAMNWTPLTSCLIISIQIYILIEDLLQFKRRSVGFTPLTPPEVGESLAKRRIVQSIPLQIIGPQLPATSGSDRSLRLAMRRPLHVDATVNSYDNLYSLKEISKAENGEAYSSATAPGVIIPCSLIVMTKVIMFAFCVCLYYVNPWVRSKRSPCLFERFLWSQLQRSIYVLVCVLVYLCPIFLPIHLCLH